MRTARRLWTLGMGATAIGIGCSSSQVAPSQEAEAASTGERIIGGEADTRYPAVVSVEGSCSGTIIQVDASSGIGWVLTAAHCFAASDKSTYVLSGSDVTKPSLVYHLGDYLLRHPRYDESVGSSYDLALVRIVGADASTPFIPLVTASEDALSTGHAITVVGFGRTVVAAKDAGVSSSPIRKSIARTVTALSENHIGHSNDGGGSCYGDSGGAVVAMQGGGPRLVGVNSYVKANSGQVNCGPTNTSYAVRVTTPVRDWVTQTIAQAPTLPSTCGSCRSVQASGKQTCADAWRTCFLDEDCPAYRNCVFACSGSRCYDACARDHARGYGLANGLEACACQACSAECTSSCLTTPKCGVAPDSFGACGACTEAKCCSELLDCATDGTCLLCDSQSAADASAPDGSRPDGSSGSPACASHPKRQSITACTRAKCQAECHPGSKAEAPSATSSPSTPAPNDTNIPSAPAPEEEAGGCALSPAQGGSDWAPVLGAIWALVRRRRRLP